MADKGQKVGGLTGTPGPSDFEPRTSSGRPLIKLDKRCGCLSMGVLFVAELFVCIFYYYEDIPCRMPKFFVYFCFSFWLAMFAK